MVPTRTDCLRCVATGFDVNIQTPIGEKDIAEGSFFFTIKRLQGFRLPQVGQLATALRKLLAQSPLRGVSLQV